MSATRLGIPFDTKSLKRHGNIGLSDGTPDDTGSSPNDHLPNTTSSCTTVLAKASPWND